jgi:hypothetical protein
LLALEALLVWRCHTFSNHGISFFSVLSQGEVQGPFAKVDILEWLSSRFFPNVGDAKGFRAKP